MKIALKCVAAVAAICLAAPATAETLRVHGVYPAGNSGAAVLDSIAVDQFGGDDGTQLGIMIEDRLRNVSIEGSYWFRIVPSSLSNDADAVLRGNVSTRYEIRRDGSKEVTRCVKRDDKRNCIDERTEDVPCERMTVRVRPTLRLLGRDGSLIHSDDSEVVKQVRFCADENQPYSDGYIDQAFGEITSRLRYALAPVERSSDIRVRESRKGMERESSRAFRDAIRQTKRDESGACDSFAALEPTIGDHESLLFNLGLCAEARGDLEAAEDYYRRTLGVDGRNGSADEGLRRVADRRVANRQLQDKSGA